jgi:hypothetical protein
MSLAAIALMDASSEAFFAAELAISIRYKFDKVTRD